MMNNIGIAIAGVQIVRFLASSVEASAEQERVFQSLAVATGNVGIAYDEVSGSLQEMFAHLQETTKYGDTDTASALQRLVTITGQYDESVNLLGPSLDFASAMQIDLATATRLVGQAATGMTGTLSRYGIVLDDNTKKMIGQADAAGKAAIIADVLNEKFGGAAQAELQTYSGRIAQLGNFWGDFKEALGDVITKTAAAPVVMEKLKNSFIGLTAWATDFGEVLVWVTNLDFDIMLSLALDKLLGTAKVKLAALLLTFSKLPLGVGQQFEDMAVEILKDVGQIAAGVERSWNDMVKPADDAAAAFRAAAGSLTSSFGAVEVAAESATEAVVTFSTHTIAGALGVVEAMEDGANQFSLFGGEANTLQVAIAAGLSPALNEAGAYLQGLGEDADTATDPVKRLEEATEEAAISMQNSFSNLLGKGFAGELETFADFWDEIWKDLAKSMTGIMGDAIEGAFGEGGAITGILGRFWGNMKKSIQDNALGAGLAGAGGVMAGFQQGGTGGFLQGAMGGMQLGGALGAIGGPAGIGLGMGIGAVAGGILSLFGGGEDEPRVFGSLGLGGSQVTQSDTDLSHGVRNVWAQQRIAEYRNQIAGMTDILRMFGDADLFGMIGDAPDFQFDAGSLSEISTIFSERWLPQAMRQMFRSAINRGLRGLGVDDATRAQLWEEMRGLGGDQIAGLETYIGALVGSSRLLEDLDFGTMLDESRLNSMESFFAGMNEILEMTEMQLLGIDSMTLLERAEQVTTIEQMVTQARRAEIAMLRQIDAVQSSITSSIRSQIEGIQAGGLEGEALSQFYRTRMADAQGRLQSATTTEAVQQAVADFQRYAGLYQQSLGQEFFETDLFGTTSPAERMISMLEQIEEMAIGRLAGFRERIEETNQAFIDQMERATNALTSFNDTLEGTGGAFGAGSGEEDETPDMPPGGFEDQDLDHIGERIGLTFSQNAVFPTPIVNIHIEGGMAALNPYIYSIVSQILDPDPDLG
jgi:hypothetical protein